MVFVHNTQLQNHDLHIVQLQTIFLILDLNSSSDWVYFTASQTFMPEFF